MVKKPNLFQRAIMFMDPRTGSNPTGPLAELMRNTGQLQTANSSGQGKRAMDAAGATPRPGFIDNYFIHKTPSGSMGTETYAGYPREEYLHELFGKDRAKIFDKMRRSDTQVKMLLGAVKNPIKAAVWEVEPASDDPEDVRRAALIRHILLSDIPRIGGFHKFIEEALTQVEFGHAVFEKTFRLVKDHPLYGTYHGIAGLDMISPKTIERWNVSGQGVLQSITQISNGDLSRYINIPAQFLLVLSMDMEGANYEGISMLRPCYGNWLRKNMMLKLNAIGVEKFAIPTPVAKIPPGFQATEQFSFLIEVLEAYTGGEAAFLTIPNSVELDLKPSTYDPEKVDTAIDAEDRRMAKAFLANFLELGLTGVGSFAMSEDLSDFFLGGLEHIASNIAATVNAVLIPELCNLNFGGNARLPKLKHSGISDKAGKELAEVLANLVSANVVEPDDLLEENIRSRYKLPKKSDLGKEGRKPPPPAPGGFGGMPPGAGGEGQPPSLSERVRRKLYGR